MTSAHRSPLTAHAAQRLFVFINGILTAPGDAEGWTDRSVTWTQSRTPHKAEKWEYATGPLLRRLRQQTRAEKIATMLAYYERAGFEIVLVGHSNGCDIIARVLELRAELCWFYQLPLRSVHLFSAAAEAEDFRSALDRDDVARIFFYSGGRDLALRAGRVSRTLFGWAGLGYGTAGGSAVTAGDSTFFNSYPSSRARRCNCFSRRSRTCAAYAASSCRT